MSNKAKSQYNGIILLSGYLQRLFVAETIYRRVDEPYDQERFNQIKSLFDEVYTILPTFEETHTLTMAQEIQLQLIVEQTKDLMSTYFKQMPLSFKQKLAIVGSSLYAEQKVNEGIIRLGELFNVEVNNDFHQRTKFYEQRTKLIDYIVFVLHHNEQPEEQYTQPIDSWFNDVIKHKDYVEKDFQDIANLLEFE